MQKGSVNIWMVTTLVLLGVIVFAAGTFFANPFGKKADLFPTPTQKPAISLAPTESISPGVTISVSPSPTIEEESDIIKLQKAFGKKYNRPATDAQVTINKKESLYIAGSIRFAGEMGGGWFLAYKGADGWMIVQDGNGIVSCETIAPYNFPKSMVPECVDKNGNLVK